MSRIDELREHYDNTDTSSELDRAEYVPADAPPASERMTTFAVRLPLPVLERVRQIAAEDGVTTSEMLRRWIEDGIAAHDGDDDLDEEIAVLHDMIRRRVTRMVRERRRALPA